MMHACFHGGGSGSRITKSVAVFRDLTKSMKAMTLKVKGGVGGNRARAPRRRRRRRKPTAGHEEPQPSASSSAKIAPAQPHEEEHNGGGRHEHCDKCCSTLDDGLAEEEEGTAPADASDGEWVAEPEPGVLMTLAPRGDGANYLRRIRFSEDHFPDAWAAQAWWAGNCDRIVELYSVVVVARSEHSSNADDDPAAPVTPCQSEDDEHQRPDGELEYSASCSASASASGGSTSNFSGPSSGSGSANKVDSPILGLVTEPNSSKRSPKDQHNQKKPGPKQCDTH